MVNQPTNDAVAPQLKLRRNNLDRGSTKICKQLYDAVMTVLVIR